MFKLLLRYGTQGLLVAAPWLVAHGGFARFKQDDQKVVLSLIALFLIFCWDAVELYIPRQRLRQLGKEYADKLAKKFEDPRYPQLGTDLRLNVMYLRGLGPLAWFRWVANYGFVNRSHTYPDAHMLLMRWQGVAGRAVGAGAPIWVDLRGQGKARLTFSERYLFKSPFRLWHTQFAATEQVLAVLSVPLILEAGSRPNPRARIVGVINLDAVSERGAEWLSDPEVRSEMLRFLADHGSFLAFLG